MAEPKPFMSTAGVGAFGNYQPAINSSEYPQPEVEFKPSTLSRPDPSAEYDELEEDRAPGGCFYTCLTLPLAGPDNVFITLLPNRIDRDKTLSTQKQTYSARLDNGKFACAHTCKDKLTCKHAYSRLCRQHLQKLQVLIFVSSRISHLGKHLCCREGTDKPPRIKRANPRTVGREASNTGQPSQPLRSSIDDVKKSNLIRAAVEAHDVDVWHSLHTLLLVSG